jgi:hypothetical protein
MLYIRKRSLGTATYFAVVVTSYTYDCLRGILLNQPRIERYAAIGYAIPAFATAFIGWGLYKLFLARLERDYRVGSHSAIEYRFMTDKLVVSVDGKELELYWSDAKKAWTSRKVLVLVYSNRKYIALPLALLGVQPRLFLIDKLAELDVLSRRKADLLKTHWGQI